MKYFIKNKHWPLALYLAILSQTVYAIPFGTFDSRSMAMGGVGVATGAKFAVFNNPALLTTADEIHEWSALVPTVGEQFNDPNNVEDSLATFKQAAINLDGSGSPADQSAVQQQLNALSGNQYSTNSNAALVLTIPSRIIGGAAFFNIYEASTAKPVIGGDNLTIPSYTSTLAQRGLRIVENGIAAGKVLETDKGWMRNVAIGFSAKFLLVSGYGYSESLRSADVDINTTNSQSGSQFDFDLGMLKEFGVWKVGLVAKNIIPGKYKYGSSGDTFKIDPQLRAGFAYQSRHSVIELDIDLVENDPVGFNTPSQIAALGWEWQAWHWLAFRAGYNQNLTGNEASFGAAGFGFNFGPAQIDVAAFSGDQGEGMSAQLGVQF